MSRPHHIRPVFATLLALLLALQSFQFAHAQRRHGSSPLDTLGEDVSQKDGFEVLSNFRRLGIAADYRLNFQLRLMPRGEKTTTVPGVMLGTMNQMGPLSRLDVAIEPAEVSERGELTPAVTRRLLLQNGIFANAMELAETEEGPVPVSVTAEDYFEPIAGSDFTVFDLLMPFSYWQEFRYEGRTTMKGRPCHAFSMFPPEGNEELKERVSKVRIYLDEEFYALIRVEIFDADEVKRKTISVVSFKVVDGQAVLSQVDVRDELSRDKTRFKVLDAAMGVELPSWVFQPEGLLQPVYGTQLATAAAASVDEPEGTAGEQGE
ncbi:outer membrane lipoprotein-sorting protein [Pelagicoccus sp. SDUM812003]|uniref:outer membrane lipoprotein-sorting protein n=1 Tax=Pelagicoccus sp. SDUM812003 TaxID=3041267 RepID=UPI00280F3DAD|nr:outer membrane lipoprotein-sorting protein [Pelagicoccus sp. SDUM812003]MDQ8202878.1 outer membrane lipoprotein-sorting protein [Pelagicoccus sp. SDUM812003]